MYDLYLNDFILPIAPPKIEISINNQNKTMNLINDNEINIVKQQALTDISFEVLLPNTLYPFATYKYGFLDADYYLKRFKILKNSKDPFYFRIRRRLANGKENFKTELLVTLESYSIIDDVSNGFDALVSLSLKEYRYFFTKTPNLLIVDGNAILTETSNRETTTSPAPKDSSKSHTVSKGDTLWGISKKYYSKGELYPNIYTENKELIDDRNKGTGNDKYTIYPNQVFVIPVVGL